MLILAFKVDQKTPRMIGEGAWTPLEVAIWLLAMVITVTLGVLVFADAIGSWAVMVPGAMGVIFGLWRWRVEAERKKVDTSRNKVSAGKQSE